MFISNRWVLDCNVAPIMLSIGVISLLQSLKPNLSTIQRLLSTTLSAIFITFSVYGYVAGWLFIPVFLLFLAISLIKQNHLSIKWLLVYAVEVIILCLPMIAFAYHFLVLHSAKDISWGPFTFPGMAMQRSNSFIDFNDPQGIMHAIVMNVTTGFQTYMQGFDHLVWNSVSGFGVVFPIFLIFVLIGILTPKNILSPNQLLFKRVLCIELLAFIPSLLVVRPNFNHWTFLNIPLILLVGYGMYYASLQIGKRYSISIVSITVIIFGIFLTNYYFTDNSYFVNGSPMTSSQSLKSDKVKKIPAKKIKQVEEMHH